MTKPPPISRVLYRDGKYAGLVWCICPHELLDQGQYRNDCPVHEDLDVARVRSIDVEEATQEQMAL